MHPVRELRRLRTIAREQYTRRLEPRYRDTSPGNVPIGQFESILAEYDDAAIFVHVGLSDVNAAFGGRSYDELYNILTEQFTSVLVPGFTPSFRDSGIYHKRYSRPEVGMFPRLFQADAEYRTNDAIHSIQVVGPYRFPDADHYDTFGPQGCYARMDADNVLIANIGTNRLVSTQFHYISMQANPPYHKPERHAGVIYLDDEVHEEITQRNDAFMGTYSWSRWKMERYLEAHGVLERRDLNGLKLSLFRAGDARRTLDPKMAEDPYYMVT